MSLSVIEVDVLRGAAGGETAGETARRMHRALGTVKRHRENVLRKLSARNVTHAVAIGYERHLLGPFADTPRPSHGGQHGAVYAKAGAIERFRRLERHTMVGVAIEATAAHFDLEFDTEISYDEQLQALTYDQCSWALTFLAGIEAEVDAERRGAGAAPPSAMSTGARRSA